MTPEQKAAYLNAQAAVLVATVLGMHAENMQRQHRGEAMAYVEESFQNVIDASVCHHNAAMRTLSD